MTSGDQLRFGTLLRQFRLAARFSQEALAERAGMSVDTVSALERAVSTAPYGTTVTRLADALALGAHDRGRLEAAAARGRRRRVVGADGPAAAQRGNLPLASAELIGRESMIADLRPLVAKRRHVTLVGSGGVGKTCVAIAVGRALEPRFRDGVWFIDLVAVTDARLVADKVAAELGLRQTQTESESQSVIAALKRRNLLLILDNCEHVITTAASLVDAILLAAPGVHVLATSREPLKTGAEDVYAVGPLDVPPASEPQTAAKASRFSAIALFAARARAADGRFALTDDNAGLVADVCRRVDGIALGVELAASRAKALGLDNLTVRLERLLPTLTGGRRTARRAHQTLRALIDWSYSLLDAHERGLLARMTIFAGGWTLDAAEAVAEDAGPHDERVLDVLSRLVDKSLVVAEHAQSATRYRLLHAVREYAAEKLEAGAERDAAAARHAAWVARFAEAAAASAWTVPRRRWLGSLMPEVDNVRAALTWALGNGDAPILAGRIVASLGLFWYYSGLAHEGRRLVETLQERLGTRAGAELEGRLWGALAALRAGAGRAQAARRAIALFERTGDARSLGVSYLQLAIAYRQMARFAHAEAAVDRALELFRLTGDDRSTYYASALGWRASVLIGQRRFDEARAHFDGDIALYEQLDDAGLAAVERLNLAELEFAAGDAQRAADLVEEGLRALRAEAAETKLGNDYSQVVFYLNLAAYRLVLGQIDAAATAAREALNRARILHYPLYTAIAVQHVATVAALGGDAAVGARLRGFVEAAYRAHGAQREPTEARLDDLLIGALRSALDGREIDRCAALGAAQSEDEAIALASSVSRPQRRKAPSVRGDTGVPSPSDR